MFSVFDFSCLFISSNALEMLWIKRIQVPNYALLLYREHNRKKKKFLKLGDQKDLKHWINFFGEVGVSMQPCGLNREAAANRKLNMKGT